MNLRNLRSDIQATIADGNAADHHEFVIARKVYLLVLVAGWTHTRAETLTLDNLSDADFRIAAEWALLTRSDYSSTVSHIQDMREILPGLSLSAMADLIRGGS